MARERGGLCLSMTYRANYLSLTWQCAKGHTWNARPSNVLQGSWCPICAHKQKLTIAIMQEEAHKHGGRCLSSVYVDGRTPLEWECAKGHRWSAIPQSIRRGCWCPLCFFQLQQARSKRKRSAKR